MFEVQKRVDWLEQEMMFKWDDSLRAFRNRDLENECTDLEGDRTISVQIPPAHLLLGEKDFKHAVMTAVETARRRFWSI